LVLLLQATKKDFRRSALMGLLNPTLYYLVLFKAYSVLPAQEAQPLNWTWPIVLSLMSALFLKQTLKLKHFLALGVSFIGVLVISTKGSFQAKMLTNFAGDLLALFSSLIWASYWIANLKDERVAEVKLWLNFAFGTIYGFPVILLFSRFPCFNPQGVLASIYIGIFEMGITFILWLKGLSLSKNSAQAGLIAYFSPFFSLIFIHSVLGETILWSSFAGLVLIITGVFLQRK
jgi:drug/metabolite transporter (DMT)-like permease